MQQPQLALPVVLYAIGTGPFASTAGTVTNGQTVTVKVMTSASNNTAVTATLTIGGVNGAFVVTTAAVDTTPDAFSFTAATDAQPNSANTSATITVAGINTATPISITGGTYSIVGGGTDLTSGTVTNGQVVTVKTTAAAAPSTPVNAVLTIGGVSATYTVTTVADTVAPTAKILFPPPVSMTEGNTILVRGTASDAYSIKSVKVNGVTAATTDGFANWQASVPLTDTTAPVTTIHENAVTVVTEDNAGNIASDAAHVAITQAPITSTFPIVDTSNKFSYVWNLAIDRLDGRNRLLLTDQSSKIFSVDLANGKRTVFATSSTCNFMGIAINSINKYAYTTCFDSPNGRIFNFDLADSSQSKFQSNALYKNALSIVVNEAIAKIVTVNDDDGAVITTDQTLTNFNLLSGAIIPSTAIPINKSWGMALDKTHNRYLVTDYSQQTIFAVDATTGVRSVFSNNSTGSGDFFGAINDKYISAIAVDELNQRAIVAEVYSGKIFTIDLATGNRSLLSSLTLGNPYNIVNNSYGIAIDDPKGYAFFSDDDLFAVLAVDLVTGHRVIFSKN